MKRPELGDGGGPNRCERRGRKKTATAPAREGERARNDQVRSGPFTLPGRPTLAAFMAKEHIVDIIRNQNFSGSEIGFPAAVVLHGPPGCGKTFAVERLIDFLEWPSFQIEHFK